MACSILGVSLHSKFEKLSISASSTSSVRSRSLPASSLSFTSSLSSSDFVSSGYLSLSAPRRPLGQSIVCEAAPTKKPDSAAKRIRQAEKRRLRNKARKSEIRTRMKKVLEELRVLRKKKEAQAEEIAPIEKLIAEAYSAIDKAVRKGVMHRNTGSNRKSRLARNKKAVEIHHGWYTPASTTSA